MLATEDQGCPAGWASQSVNEGRKVGETRKGEMMQDAKRRGRADYWKDLEPVLVEKIAYVRSNSNTLKRLRGQMKRLGSLSWI